MKKLELGRLWSLPQATELECGRARNKIFWLQIQCSRIVVSEFASLGINSKKHVSVYLFLKRGGLLVSSLRRFPYPPPNEYTLASSNDCPACVHKAVYQTDSAWSVCLFNFSCCFSHINFHCPWGAWRLSLLPLLVGHFLGRLMVFPKAFSLMFPKLPLLEVVEPWWDPCGWSNGPPVSSHCFTQATKQLCWSHIPQNLLKANFLF